MIERLKRFLKALRQDLKAVKYGQNQLWATQKLQSLFAESHFIPQTPWSLSPQAIVHCLNIISINKPKSIIEFGSGAATIYMAQFLKLENQNAHIYSVESDEKWKLLLEKQLISYDLQDFVTIILAPVVKAEKEILFENQELWYNVEAINAVIKSVREFDLIIVDGPYGGSTPFARFSAFPFLESRSTENTVWLLDDTERQEEKQIIKEWHKRNGGHKLDYKRYCMMTGNTKYDLAPYRMQ